MIGRDFRPWRAVIERHESYDELVLWFEHDLFDQLNLIQLLTWIRERLPPAKTVSLVCIGSFPGHVHFKGLGELSAAELASLLETRQRVSEDEYSLAKRAWQAFRGPTPEPLDALRRTDTSALPYLASSIERFLQEYPWTTDGLSRTERRLLEVANAGTVDLSSAFHRMHHGEDVYYITDLSLADLAQSLSCTSPPAAHVRVGADLGGPPPSGIGHADGFRPRSACWPAELDCQVRHRPLARRRPLEKRFRGVALGQPGSSRDRVRLSWSSSAGI
jgi:hypothetical protein